MADTMHEAAQAAPEEKGTPERPAQPFLVVAIGASAGGLEPLKLFFDHLPPAPGMAFLVLQHRKAGESLMGDILRYHTALEVLDAADGSPVKADTVYVLPPDKDCSLVQGVIQFRPMPENVGLWLPIDALLRNLAAEIGEQAVAVILSGTGSDGTLGVKAVKAAGGMVMVQDPQTAANADMPRNAMAGGLVDAVLAPAEMPQSLLAWSARIPVPPSALEGLPEETLRAILDRLRAEIGHDFSGYKRSTISRRILRRVGIRQVADAADYVRLLSEDPAEVRLLFRDMLIGVTSFFRDAEAFETLRDILRRELDEKIGAGEGFRAWIPGCSSGEEAYSLAIIVKECLNELGRTLPVQIFATDLSAQAIDEARQGAYPENIAADLTPQRLQRFFVKQDRTWRVSKEIREMTVFAVQNVLQDPPFSGLDLICCRNLLIYIDTEAQRKVLGLFHYALKDKGLLFLGTSESADPNADLFSQEDKRWRIFRRKPARGDGQRIQAEHRGGPATRRDPARVDPRDAVARPEGYKALVERFVLQEISPTAILVNEFGDILHIHGRTGCYLEMPAGELTRNIQSMAREGLASPLAAAISLAALRREEVLRPGLRVKTNGDYETVDLSVRVVAPQTGESRPLLLVVLTTVGREAPADEAASPLSAQDQRLLEMERELQQLRAALRTTVEEYETVTEELKSSNEELQSSNEELQSSNEELDTAKEEMHSANEELSTVNAELRSRVEELAHVNSDMANLLASSEFAILYLDAALNIKRYTPAATRIFNIIPSDVGRPLAHVVAKTGYRGLPADAAGVFQTLKPREVEILCEDGTYYRARLKPYRTVDNAFDGVVVTFTDISELKQTQARLEQTLRESQEANAAAGSMPTPSDASAGEPERPGIGRKES